MTGLNTTKSNTLNNIYTITNKSARQPKDARLRNLNPDYELSSVAVSIIMPGLQNDNPGQYKKINTNYFTQHLICTKIVHITEDAKCSN